ncbi:uncharacterized protein A4U43_C08F30160 [Asparagus officinalis]|uniref:uncharacterized protein LOC109820077 n=1 Tax=Asparagus officinalis TaxID=4686 RepID=UPI00098E2D14|nr:uncharacterized protein LOC109820077 [Asparagus officinalis]ONK61461.1 uncharacterized protein A4U43_C08F30160 [Asparagus officinalis]
MAAKIITLTLLFILITLTTSEPIPPKDGPQPVDSPCKGNITMLRERCEMFVKPYGPAKHPSVLCCNAIDDSDIPCICRHYITPRVEKLISMEKVVYAAEKCHRAFAPGDKCGSYTVPGA